MKNIKHTYEKITGIYCILNLSNSKIYIGSSKHIYYRLREHLHKLRTNKHHSSHLQRSFDKNGEDSFYSILIERCEEDRLIGREEYWMDLLKADYNKVFKDLERPASSYSQETKDKISKSVKAAHEAGLLHSNRMVIYVYDKQGKYLGSERSLVECSSKYNTGISSIQRVLNGRHKQTNGYQFRKEFEENLEPITKVVGNKFKIKVLLEDTINKTLIEFNSISKCATYLKADWHSIENAINNKRFYRNRYSISRSQG